MSSFVPNFDYIRNNGYLLFESVRGSHLFGLDTPDSDIDTFGIFIGPKKWFFGDGSEKRSIVLSDKSDDYWDELEKFILELGNSNPEAIVSIFTPEKHIKYFNPILKPLWDVRDSVITKRCFSSFAGYATSQIKKAKGLKKAINTNPEEVKERKSPLDFCQVGVGIGTWTLAKWLRDNNFKQEYCGISRLPGTVESYALFYDYGADPGYPKRKGINPIGYRGILSPTDPLSSQLRVSSIPFGERDNPLCYFQFNSGAYSQHCMDYKRYWNWVANRNPKRYAENKEYNYDSKNFMHCVRILTLAKEVAQGLGLRLDRSNIDRDFLLKIRRHEFSYEWILEYTEKLFSETKESFIKSSLPEEPDKKLLNDILIGIREEFYKKA